MSALDLPPATPLPREVRERVLRTVVAGTRIGALPLVVAAAVLVAVLAVMASVALGTDVSGIDPLARPAPTSLPTPPPPTSTVPNLP